jgi:hypothetical protein
MLTVDDDERVAALARSVTSRGPQRSDRSPAPAQPSAAAAAPAKKQQQQPKQKPQREADETSPPAASRPVALRPRQAGADDALLTPQELAAAFQLNFAPAGGAAGPGGASGGTPRRKRSRGSKLFGLFAIAAVGVGALMYFRPDVREQATEWSTSTYASVKEFISSRTTPARDDAAAEERAIPTTRARGDHAGAAR